MSISDLYFLVSLPKKLLSGMQQGFIPYESKAIETVSKYDYYL